MAQEELVPKAKRESQEQPSTRPGRVYVPDVDISEDEHALWFWTDMPGVTQERVDVELDGNLLTIRGHVSLEEYEGLKPILTEYNVGDYACQFRLGDSSAFNRDGFKARMTNGVLELELPKAEKVKPRRIPVSPN